MAVLAVFIGTFGPRPLIKSAMSGQPGRTIYFLTNAIHTDIVIRLDDDTRRRFAFLGQGGLPMDNPNAEWLIVGWGGRSFYIETRTWADLKAVPVLRAFTADNSVMHVEVAGALDTDDPSLLAFSVNDADFADLVEDVLETFTKDPLGNPVLIRNAAYGEYDNFYEANGWFNALVGCNTWAARMARVAGLRTGIWNPLPQSLRLSLRLYN